MFKVRIWNLEQNKRKQYIFNNLILEYYGKLCCVKNKRINELLKNNLDKFPERYCWILNENKLLYLRSKLSTTGVSSKSRSKPHVFTEQGIAMLATVLKSDVATKVSIKIMDTFVAIKKYILINIIEDKNILEKIIDEL
jgi:hypothetical protein